MKKIVLLAFVLVLSSVAMFVRFTRPVEASGTIYIRADGSIEGTTHISTFDNATYTFTDNIFNQSIVVEKDNIVVDGAGYTLKGTGTEYSKGITLFQRTNVTINNIKIETFYFGIYLDGSSFNTIYGNNITNNHYGIYLISSNRINVSGNTITSDINVYGVESISLYYSNENIFGENLITNNQSVGSIGIRFGHHDDNNILIQNIITNNEWGIYVEDYNENNTIVDNTISNNSWTGIYLCDSDKNSVVDNTVSHNQEYGIYVYRCCDSIILSNILSRNKCGIYLDDNAKRNNISCNIISSNGCGVCLWKLNATDNRIYHNNFMSNTAASLLSNAWDNGYPSGGNYWSDYTDVDQYSGPYQNETGSDGIWDHPYVIYKNNQDNYPLMSPWGDIEPPIADAGPDLTVYVGTTVTFDGSKSSDDVAIKSYVWAFTDITPQTLIGMHPNYPFNNVGDFKVTLNVSDYAGYWDTDTMWVHVLSDTTKPSICTVSQEPQVPDEGEKVIITVNVTDGESGVHNVTISYKTNSGAWTNVSMSKLTGDTWEGEILGLPVETNVQYKIIAYDKAGNFEVDDQLGQYYVYTVIPEFPTWTSMLIILILLTVAILLGSRLRDLYHSSA